MACAGAGPCLAAVAGCALLEASPSGELRDEVVIHAPLPEQWSACDAAGGNIGDSWIAMFADPQLDTFVTEAMQYSGDLRSTAVPVDQVATYVRVSAALESPPRPWR